METIKSIDKKELRQLIEDVELLKGILLSSVYRKDPEGELSDWAKKELEKARKTPSSKFFPLEEAKKRILQK